MKASLKSEFRKLFSVRSTYVVSIIAFIFVTIFAFWVEGYKGLTGSAASDLTPKAAREILINAGGTASIFIAIIGILFVVHEYRYNTIMYTVTATNSRTRVLLSKLIVVLAYAIGLTILISAYAYAVYLLGLSLRNASLPAQDWNIFATFGKTLIFNISYGVIGMTLAFWTRNMAGALASLFIVPVTLEPLLGLLLRENAAYLPFSVLDRVMASSVSQYTTPGAITPERALVVSCIYLVGYLLFTWVLFTRRDVN